MKRITFVFVIVFLFTTALFSQTALPMSLQDCIKVALENNSRLRISEQRLQSAGADVTTAYAGLMPRINSAFSTGRYIQGARVMKTDVPIGVDLVTGRAIYEQQEIVQKRSERNAHSASVSLSQDIFDFGQTIYSIKQSKVMEQVAEHTVKSTQQSVILSVKEAYYELLKAYRLKEVYAEAVKQSEEELSRAQSRMDIGVSSRAEVFQAKVSLGSQQTNIINQENIVEMAKANLNNAMARDAYAPLEISEDKSEPIFPTISMQDAAAASVQNNEELKAMSLDVKSSYYGVKVAQSRYMPSLGGSISYNRNNDDITRVYSTELDRDFSASLGVRLDLNIFNGFSDKAGVQRATINNQIAQENYNDRKRTVEASVKQYFLQLEAYKDIIEINQQNIEAAQENLRLQLEKRRVGSGTELEVTQAQVELTRAQSNFVRAEYDAKIARAQLEMVMGVPAGNK
jgi:outer membrane protein